MDRVAFSEALTRAVDEHPRVEVRTEEVRVLPDASPAVLATGPLTSDALAREIRELCEMITGVLSDHRHRDAVRPGRCPRARRGALPPSLGMTQSSL